MGYCGEGAPEKAKLMALLEVHNLTKYFGGLKANEDISFSIKKEELVGLIGPNGAGKTTLFNCIAGLYPVSSGKIIFSGHDITALKDYEVARLGLARSRVLYAHPVQVTGQDSC